MLGAFVTSCLFPLLLLVHAWTGVQSHAHSLHCNLTVQLQSRPGQAWCEVQVSVDKELILQYDSESNEVRPLGPLREKLKATRAWTELPQTLGDMGRELRMILPDINLEGKKTRGPPTLQVELSCQCEAGRCTGGPLKFNINGQTTLMFEPINMNWTLVDPGARGVKEDWEKNGQVEYFMKFSKGDCNHWLSEFSDLWEKELEPPVPPLQSSASPPSTQKNISWIIGGVFGSILFGFILFSVILSLCQMRKSGRIKAHVPLQGSNVETIRDVGDEELNVVSGGSPAELDNVSGAVPEVTSICGEPLFPKSSCLFELIP